MTNGNTTKDADVHVVFHSVIKRTGGTRYLVTEILPTIGPHHLVAWWPTECSDDGDEPLSVGSYLRGDGSSPFFKHSRLVIFVLQILYIWRRRKTIGAVTINSIANIGAVIGCFLLRKGSAINVFVHERPVGKWKLPIAMLRHLKSAHVVTVSPFNKIELQGVGVASAWNYPRAFSEGLATTRDSTEILFDRTDSCPDIVIVGHPDESKGFGFMSDLISQIDQSISINVFLSSAPKLPMKLPCNVKLCIGKHLVRSDYHASLTVITSDPLRVRETFSYIVAESLAAGTPVLCFPSGGISEQIIHGVNGYFADAYTVKDFNDSITRLFSNSREAIRQLRIGVLAVNECKTRACL